jgi:hypothetical protein
MWSVARFERAITRFLANRNERQTLPLDQIRRSDQTQHPQCCLIYGT